MKVLVVRHGIALAREDARAAGILDADRPLTAKGRDRMRDVAKALAARAPRPVRIVSSPLRRARETSDILNRALGDLPYEETAALSPDAAPEDLCDFLARSGDIGPVAVVGHEPHLSAWVTFCLRGEGPPVVEVKKGGACLLEFEGVPEAGRARVLWLAPPSFLRRLTR